METVYRGITGKFYSIEEEKIAGGGEGNIYGVKGDDNIVIKIFKPQRRNYDREQKLCMMVKTKLTSGQLEQITWPQDVIYDETGFAGYVMPKLKDLDSLNAIYSSEKYDMRHRLLAAINLCYALQTVHNMGQVCGDLNPQNICINLDQSDKNKWFHITLVDTDSYHFSTEGMTYRCEVGLPDYIAPEVQEKMMDGNTLRTAQLPTYTKETDLFALAVHIFTLLMNGSHPFACAKGVGGNFKNTMEQMKESYVRDSVVAPQPIENIREGFFPFYERKDGLTRPSYAPSFDLLPTRLQKLFIRTFVDGYQEPVKRAGTQEWIDALTEVCKEVVRCGVKEGHYFFAHSTKCPLCATEKRMIWMMNGIMSSSKSSESSDVSNGSGSSGTSTTSGSSDSSDLSGEKDSTLVVIWRYLQKIILILMLIGLGILICMDLFYNKGPIEPVEVETPIPSESLDEPENPVQEEESVGMDTEQSKKQKEEEKAAKACLKYVNKIKTKVNNKNYSGAVKLIKKGWKKKYIGDENKIYVKDGKLVDTIKNGKGFVYYVIKEYIYMGKFKDGKPSGSGKEVGNPRKTAWGGYYTIKGTFKNGYPNGKCTVFYSKLWSDNAATFTGTYKNGWENGSFKWIDKSLNGGHSDTYYFSSSMGTRKVIRMDGKKYVYAKANSSWYYYATRKGQLKKYTTEHHGKK